MSDVARFCFECDVECQGSRCPFCGGWAQEAQVSATLECVACDVESGEEHCFVCGRSMKQYAVPVVADPGRGGAFDEFVN